MMLSWGLMNVSPARGGVDLCFHHVKAGAKVWKKIENRK